MAGTPRERGLALVLVLWMTTLIGFLAAGFLSDARTEARVIANAVDQAEARALALGGVQWGALRLVERGRRSPDLRPSTLPVNGTPLEATTASVDGRVVVRIQDARGLIDLNTASPELLTAALVAIGVGPEDAPVLAARIVDYRDPDQEPFGAVGAEDADYAARGLAHDAKDASFESVAELSQIPGFGRDLVARLGEVTTIANRTPMVDLAVAGDAVRRIVAAVQGPNAPAAPRQVGGSVFRVTVEATTATGAVHALRARVRLVFSPAQPFVLDRIEQLVVR